MVFLGEGSKLVGVRARRAPARGRPQGLPEPAI
jgi:hypothetical protein